MYDEQETKAEHDIQEIANNVMEGFGLQHPIMFDKYNLWNFMSVEAVKVFRRNATKDLY